MGEGAVWSFSGCALFLLCFRCSNMILPWSCITLCHYDHKVTFHTAALWNSVKTNMPFRVFQKTTTLVSSNTQCGDYKDRSPESLICSLILCLHRSFHYDPSSHSVFSQSFILGEPAAMFWKALWRALRGKQQTPPVKSVYTPTMCVNMWVNLKTSLQSEWVTRWL